MKYECECTKNMERVESYENCIPLKTNRPYLAITNDVRLNQQNDEWE